MDDLFDIIPSLFLVFLSVIVAVVFIGYHNNKSSPTTTEERGVWIPHPVRVDVYQLCPHTEDEIVPPLTKPQEFDT